MLKTYKKDTVLTTLEYKNGKTQELSILFKLQLTDNIRLLVLSNDKIYLAKKSLSRVYETEELNTDINEQIDLLHNTLAKLTSLALIEQDLKDLCHRSAIDTYAVQGSIDLVIPTLKDEYLNELKTNAIIYVKDNKSLYVHLVNNKTTLKLPNGWLKLKGIVNWKSDLEVSEFYGPVGVLTDGKVYDKNNDTLIEVAQPSDYVGDTYLVECIIDEHQNRYSGKLVYTPHGFVAIKEYKI